MSVLDRLRAEHEYEIKLPSGLTATITLPWVQDCIAAVGDVPLPVLQKLEKQANAETPTDLTSGDMAVVTAYNNAMIRLAVRSLDGEPVTLPDDEPVSAFLDEADAMEVVAYASRSKPLPGKE
jgi:hypothetical protein